MVDRQTADNIASLNFYRLDALPDVERAVSKY